MNYLLLVLAFLLELVAFAGFVFSSSLMPIGTPAQISVGIFLFILLILFWSRYMAPKASNKLTAVPYFVAKGIIYSICAGVLFFKFSAVTGAAFMLLWLLDEVLLYKHNGKIEKKSGEKE